MKIILSPLCESVTGALDRSLGYHIEHRKNGFFSKRNSRGLIPPDGHWRFIVLCAEQAQVGFLFSDTKVSQAEMLAALQEAGLYGVGPVGTYNARRVLEFKKTYGL